MASWFWSHKKDLRIVPNLRKFLVLTLLLYLWSPSFRRIKTSAKPPPGMFFPSKSVMVTSPFHNWFLRKESESRILRMKLDWKTRQGHKTFTHKPTFLRTHWQWYEIIMRELSPFPSSRTEGTKTLPVFFFFCPFHATLGPVKGLHSASEQHQHIGLNQQRSQPHLTWLTFGESRARAFRAHSYLGSGQDTGEC